jgi:HD-like signal output (HDOD) protein
MSCPVTDLELAAAVEELPPVSSVLQRLITVLQDPKSDLDDIGRLVRTDTALTTKVLRLANSAHFALPARVTSIEEAVQQIGVNEVHRLVSALGGRQLFERVLTCYGITAEHLWEHTLTVGLCAELVAGKIGGDRGAAYLVAMLHPIGFVALDRVAAARKLAPRTFEVPLLDWEREHFGTDNAGAAARVMLHWKFPEELAASVASRYEVPTSPTVAQPGGILHVASCLAERLGVGLAPEGGLFRFSGERIASFGLSAAQFADLENDARLNLARTRTLLKLA